MLLTVPRCGVTHGSTRAFPRPNPLLQLKQLRIIGQENIQPIFDLYHPRDPAKFAQNYKFIEAWMLRKTERAY